MDKYLAGLHRGEHVGLLVVLARPRRKGRVNDGRPGGQAEVGVAIDPDDLPQVGHIEDPLDVVDLRLVDPEPFDQPGAKLVVHAGADLEPDDLAKAPAAELVLDGGQQVVGLVVYLEVGVTGDAEEVVADDLQARERGRRGGARSRPRAG